jgi:chemotaxis protein MotA
MDIASIIGAVMGLGIIGWTMHHEGGFALFWNTPGFILVFGGVIASAFLAYPLQACLSLPAVVKKCFLYPLPSPLAEIERMADYAVLARREGLLGLEEKSKEIKDPFLSKGVMLVVDGFSAESVREILEIDLAAMKERHLQAKKIVDNMSAMAPGYGMVGTLLGLVGMLARLSDPSTIGSSMAVSLLATFYGAAGANVIFMPLASKLEARTKEEALIRQLMIEGILAIQKGDKPQVLRERLKAFLNPKARSSLATITAAKKDPAAVES